MKSSLWPSSLYCTTVRRNRLDAELSCQGNSLSLSAGVGDTCPGCGVTFGGSTNQYDKNPKTRKGNHGKTQKDYQGSSSLGGKIVGYTLLGLLVSGAGIFAIAFFRIFQQESSWNKYMEDVKAKKPSRKKPRSGGTQRRS